MQSGYEQLVREQLEAATGAARDQNWAAVLDHANHALLLAPESSDAQRFRDAALRALGMSAVPPAHAPRGSLDEIADTVEKARTRYSSARGLVRDLREVGVLAIAGMSLVVTAAAAIAAWIGNYVTGTILDKETQGRLSDEGVRLFFSDPWFVLHSTLPLLVYIGALYGGWWLIGRYDARLSPAQRLLAWGVLTAAFLPVLGAAIATNWQIHNHVAVSAFVAILAVVFVATGLAVLLARRKYSAASARSDAVTAAGRRRP